MNDQKPIKIFLADDHPLLRLGLRISLAQEKGFELIGEAADGFDAVEKIQAYPPDVSIIDMDMPGLSGIDIIRILRKSYSQMKIVVLSTYKDENYIQGAMKAGANGYVLKCVCFKELVKIIRAFHEGKKRVSPYLVNLTLCGGDEQGEVKAVSFKLTQREKEILKYIYNGKRNKEISDNLNISIETVKSHVKSVYWKLNVKNRVEASRMAIEKNLLE
jgi:DNA-binding NarL/FixJ family response regulator